MTKTATNFTPGPWRLDRSVRDSIFVEAGHRGINERTIVTVSLTETEWEKRNVGSFQECVARTKPVKTAEADAYLIASAPAMYEALNGLANTVDGFRIIEEEIRAAAGNTNWEVLQHWIDEARNALALARGEKP